MAAKINPDDMKFDTVSYSKQHNIIQIIKYLRGTVAETINSNADESEQVVELIRDIMGDMSNMLDYMLEILDLYDSLTERITGVERQLDGAAPSFIKDQIEYNSRRILDITEMTGTFNGTNLDNYLRNL